MWAESDLKTLASRQFGLVARAQLQAMGVTDSDIRRRKDRRRLELVHPGVYYLDAVTRTWQTEVLAGVMAAGPDAVASHRCAAVLWEFDAIYGRMIEVTVPYLESPEPRGVILHRSRRPNPAAVHSGIPVTSPERTLMDLAPMVPRRTLEKAARSAIHDGLTTSEKLDLAVAVFGGRGVAGTRAMRTVIRLVADDQSGSPAEIDLKHIVLDAPIPLPVQQVRIPLPDSTNAYPDFSWPDRKRIVEVDGFSAHSTPDQLQTDWRRQNQLLELGWEIRRYTATEVREEPERVRIEITRFINEPFREGL